MKKKLTQLFVLFLILSCHFSYAQTQIGNSVLGESSNDYFGFSVALSADGTRMAVGGPKNTTTELEAGQVRVFELFNGGWVQLGSDFDSDQEGSFLGSKVALSDSGSRLAISSVGYDIGNNTNAGQVRIYDYVDGEWIQQGDFISGISNYSNFGRSIDFSGDGTILAVGTGVETAGSFSGQTRVFTQDSNDNWQLLGTPIDGDEHTYSGYSVSLSEDGTILAVGGPEINTGAGVTKVHNFNGTIWEQVGQTLEGENYGDEFGISVALSANGDRLVVGVSENSDSTTLAGKTIVYQNNGGSWEPLGDPIYGENPGDRSGVAVDMSSDGDRIAIGSPDSNDGGIYSGQVRVYELSGNVWTKLGIDIEGSDPKDRLGYAVSMSADGSLLAIGGPQLESFNAPSEGAGKVKVYYLNPFHISLDITACGSYTSLSNNEYTNSGIYEEIFTDANGMDSIVAIFLTIPEVNTDVIFAEPTLTASSENAIYQWLDCSNDFAIISGEVNESFTPNDNGLFALQVIEYGCVDTSECVAINTVNLLENNLLTELKVFPNPSQDKVFVNLNSIYTNINLRLYNSLGQLVVTKTHIQTDELELILPSTAGLYLLQLETEDGQSASVHVVKSQD